MNASQSLSIRLCAWAQVCLLLINGIGLPSALAASGDDLSFSDLAKLSSLETVIYGSSYKNLPSDKRIGSLERILLGKVQKGPLPTRLAAIVSTVNGQHNNLLSPPIAPELDRSDTITKTATPPVAPQTVSDANSLNEDMPPTGQEDRIKSMLQQAMQLYSQGQSNQAETIFKNVLSLDSQNGDANFNLGAIAEGKSDWQNALHYYQAAHSAEPNDKDILVAMQSMETKIKNAQSSNMPSQNQNQQAQIIPGKLSPQQMDVLRQKVSQAASYYQNGNYDAAINILRDVANQAPDQADVQYALGQAYAAKGQIVDAQSALARAVALAPNNQDYKKALFDLSQQMAGTPAGKAPETFGSNGNYGSGNIASNQNNGPIGQITPFTGDNGQPDNQSGWQSAAPSARFYSGGNYFGPSYTPSYMPGYVSGGYSPFGFGGGMGTAAMAGMAGMALGSMFSLMMSHRRW